MNYVSIVIDGPPVAKGRPRIGRVNGHAMAFTPAKTRQYENLIKLASAKNMIGRAPLDCPLFLRVLVALPIPSSWSKRKQAKAEAGEIRPTKRPDIDNFIKAVLDGLNGIVLRDDSLVVCLNASKIYSMKPRLEIDVMEIAPGDIALDREDAA